MQLFYSPDINPTRDHYTFNKEESKHIVQVLRKTIGQTLMVTDGKGHSYATVIVVATKNSCEVKITAVVQKPNPDYHLHLAIAPTKMNDRFEWFLEKATEIGIQEITPILCAHSERKVIKELRFEKILQGSMKQSLRYFLPKLNPLTTFSTFITNQSPENCTKYIAHCDAGEKSSLKHLIPRSKYQVLIGPEGDFSLHEIQEARDAGYTSLDLGSSRLRTETAAIVACQNIAFMHQ